MIFSALFAGFLMFLAPCTLPLVPGYLSIISGVTSNDLTTSLDTKKLKKKIFLNGLYFMAGFAVIFIAFGILAGLLGAAVAPYREIFARVGGAVVVFFGLVLMGLFKIPALERVWKPQISTNQNKPKNSAFVVGAAIAFGWTPCVGPILASILLLVSATSTVLQGGILLLVFSLGLAIPFLIIAYWAGSAYKIVRSISKYSRWVNVVGGIFLVAIGLLLLFDSFYLLLAWSYQIFDFLNYEKLQNFL